MLTALFKYSCCLRCVIHRPRHNQGTTRGVAACRVTTTLLHRCYTTTACSSLPYLPVVSRRPSYRNGSPLLRWQAVLVGSVASPPYPVLLGAGCRSSAVHDCIHLVVVVGGQWGGFRAAWPCLRSAGFVFVTLRRAVRGYPLRRLRSPLPLCMGIPCKMACRVADSPNSRRRQVRRQVPCGTSSRRRRCAEVEMFPNCRGLPAIIAPTV